MSSHTRPLVTIGICTYNRADSYLRAALQSAVDQTYPNLEIVVSDNCSTDHTAEVVASFADPRIRYIRQEQNLGVTGNFNFAANSARGAYFLLLCDDDLIDRDFVETCMDTAGDRTDLGMIRTGMRRIDAHGRTVKDRPNLVAGLPPKEFFLAWFRGGETPMHLCSTLFNTQGLRDVGGFRSPRNLFCDVTPSVHLAATRERLDIREVKASFRTHATNNAAAGRIRDWCVDSQYLLDEILQLLDDPDAEFRKAATEFFAGYCLERARTVRLPGQRVAAYRIVYDAFPSMRTLILRTLISKPLASFTRRWTRRSRQRLAAVARV
jgi:glycosyltransferase involved in cell wall biosynthesis